MPVSQEYKEYIMDLLDPIDDVIPRPMFGGVGLFMDGLMFGIISHNDQFFFKVDDDNRRDFEDAGSGPFKPDAARSVTMSYYEVPVGVMEDQEKLALWAKNSWGAARRAAAGKSKMKRK